MFTFEQTRAGYAHLWDAAKVYSSKVDAEALATKTANRIIALRSTFEPVESATGVPWWMVGGILYRESDLNIHTYLGNGQSLSRRTTVVPIGRGPFASFLAGAVDAIHLERIPLNARWTIELALYWTERLNGFGYFALNVNSPYIWNWTDLYSGGKYVADHQFSRDVWDPQGGVAAIWKELFKLENIVPLRESGAEPVQKPGVVAPPLVPSVPTSVPSAAPADDLIGALNALLVEFPAKIVGVSKKLRTDIEAVVADVQELESLFIPQGQPKAKGSAIVNAITSNPVTSTFGGATILATLWPLVQGIMTKDPNQIGIGILGLLSGLQGLAARDGHK